MNTPLAYIFLCWLLILIFFPTGLLFIYLDKKLKDATIKRGRRCAIFLSIASAISLFFDVFLIRAFDYAILLLIIVLTIGAPITLWAAIKGYLNPVDKIDNSNSNDINPNNHGL